EVLKPGSIFGNISFHEGKTTHFAEASQDSFFCIFSIEDFIAIIHSKPELMIKFLQLMSEKMQSYEKRLKRGIFDAKEKIIQQLDVFLEEQKRSNMLSKLLSVKSKNDP
ncbi:Crp/Fnr family transcriptional regulator, partial [Candidatus Peregrinibacteria bacterium]|nr:Crp/Fnr family transcriptional regulator [Candidatus Peregrinibacteria bacterium]